MDKEIKDIKFYLKTENNEEIINSKSNETNELKDKIALLYEQVENLEKKREEEIDQMTEFNLFDKLRGKGGELGNLNLLIQINLKEMIIFWQRFQIWKRKQ